MALQRVTYGFTIRLPVSRPRAYRWATDYRADDLELGGIPARRRVQKLTQDLILLTDSFDADPFSSHPGTRSVKKKLVHLYPSQWSWTSTHVSGPVKFSQFLYRLTPAGPRASVLHFTGSQVEPAVRAPTTAILARRAKELRYEDSQLWARFAAALAQGSD